MENKVLILTLTSLILPTINSLNYELYHIEYVKEEGEYFLRIYIDTPDGITLDDCEKVSRPISGLLDINDPIGDSYYLEISSPGINRYLYTSEHLDRFKGSQISIKLNEPLEGKKTFKGRLVDFSDSEININVDQNSVLVPRSNIKSINLEGEL